MGLRNKIAQYRAYKSGVKHCTFDPEGPGVVRVHLVPPKFSLFSSPSYLMILNGYYVLPLGYSWAVLLSAFIDSVNEFGEGELTEEETAEVFDKAVEYANGVYPDAAPEVLAADLDYILDVIFAVARGEECDAEIEGLSVRAYAKHMTAPHRMDLAISSVACSRGWRCNQKCIFCYAKDEKYSAVKELTTEEWKRCIDKLRQAGVPMLTFTGGEPTQRSDLVELVKYSSWFITRVNTNGVLLTEGLASELREAGLDSLQITLYSSDEGIHNTLVGSTHFKDTVGGIKNALEAGLDVSVNTPLCSLNKDYLKTLEFLNSLGVRYVTVSGLICTGGAAESHGAYDLSEEELYLAVKGAKEFCDGHGMEMDFTSPGLIPEEKLKEIGLKVPACGAALSNMSVAPDGTVVPCQSWLCEGAALGNILEVPFKKIFDHKLCKKLRKMTEDEARDCPFRKEGGLKNEQ